jgi:hypothetical protein
MKKLPKVMSNVFGAGGGMSRSPTFNISMKEYEDMAIKRGDEVGIEINKVDSSEIQRPSHYVTLLQFLRMYHSIFLGA